jgi:hypothetical protein
MKELLLDLMGTAVFVAVVILIYMIVAYLLTGDAFILPHQLRTTLR